MKKKITTTKTFKYDAEGRITEETVTTVEEDVPSYNHYWYPIYPRYYPYVNPYIYGTTSAGSITSTGTTHYTFNQDPKDK